MTPEKAATMLAADVRNAVVQSEVAADGRSCRVVFRFDEGLDLFKGHFPGNPLVPGILQIEMAHYAAQTALGATCVVKEISKAKFIAPLYPGESATAEVRLVADGERFRADANVSVDGEARSVITLFVSKEEAS